MAPTSSRSKSKSSSPRKSSSASSRSKSSKSKPPSKNTSKSSSSTKTSKPHSSNSSSREKAKQGSASQSKSRKTESSSRKKTTKALSDGDYPPGTYFDDDSPSRHRQKHRQRDYIPPPHFPSAGSSRPPMYGMPPASVAGKVGGQGLKSVFKGSKKALRFCAETGLEFLEL